MADYSIAADEIGAYELNLNANEVVTAQFEAQNVKVGVVAHIIVHASDDPVYVRSGNTVEVRDPRAVVVDAGTWVDIPLSDREGASVALISASTAVVSVTRA